MVASSSVPLQRVSLTNICTYYLPRSLLSSSSGDGGDMNTYLGFSVDFFTCSAPCTSISKMHTLPCSMTVSTAFCSRLSGKIERCQRPCLCRSSCRAHWHALQTDPRRYPSAWTPHSWTSNVHRLSLLMQHQRLQFVSWITPGRGFLVVWLTLKPKLSGCSFINRPITKYIPQKSSIGNISHMFPFQRPMGLWSPQERALWCSWSSLAGRTLHWMHQTQLI